MSLTTKITCDKCGEEPRQRLVTVRHDWMPHLTSVPAMSLGGPSYYCLDCWKEMLK